MDIGFFSTQIYLRRYGSVDEEQCAKISNFVVQLMNSETD